MISLSTEIFTRAGELPRSDHCSRNDLRCAKVGGRVQRDDEALQFSQRSRQGHLLRKTRPTVLVRSLHRVRTSGLLRRHSSKSWTLLVTYFKSGSISRFDANPWESSVGSHPIRRVGSRAAPRGSKLSNELVVILFSTPTKGQEKSNNLSGNIPLNVLWTVWRRSILPILRLLDSFEEPLLSLQTPPILGLRPPENTGNRSLVGGRSIVRF